jgi:peroxiredoxin
MLDAEITPRGGRVLAISIDEDERNVQRFVQRNDLRLPVLIDGPNGLARELDLRNVPLTLVLGRNGDVAYATSRADETGINALIAVTRQLLADRPVASTVSTGGSR